MHYFQELMINATASETLSVATMTPRDDLRQSSEESKHSTHGSTPASADKPSAAKDGSTASVGSVAAADPDPAVREAAEEEEEWSKLRCGSLCTEELARKEKQKQQRQKARQNRCPDYPGFAFGSAMFGSDTTMKFNIIKNELHNIMRSQLKRVDGEVKALSSRIKEFDKKLEESERYIREATTVLSEAVALQIEESKNRSEEDEKECELSAFDQHVLFLEAQLREARIKAALSVQILEDCNQEQEILLNPTLDNQPSNQPPPPLLAQPSTTTINSNIIQHTDNNDSLTNQNFDSSSVVKSSLMSQLCETNNNIANTAATYEDSLNANIPEAI